MRKYFPIRRGPLRRPVGEVRAVDGLTFDIMSGETLGLLGEQGSGKSTIGRVLMRLSPLTSGEITFAGRDLTGLRGGELRRLRREMQLIFPDPYAALNPRLPVGRIIEEPLEIHNIGNSLERAERAAELLQLVRVNPFLARRFPHEISGGQRQRVSIARSLASEPIFIIADEPVAAYQPPVRAQLLGLLADLQQRLGLTCLLLSRDPATVRAISDRVGILHWGRLVELGACMEVFALPLHPHTQALLAEDSSRNRASMNRGGNPGATSSTQNPANLPTGCRFHPRCPLATDVCREVTPSLRDLGPPGNVHLVACHHAAISSPGTDAG